jgi:hypothetical protein
MNIRELINEAKERCPQCGMTDCTCAPGKCKCKPIAGWIPNKGFKKQGMAESEYDGSDLYSPEANKLGSYFIKEFGLTNEMDQQLAIEIVDNCLEGGLTDPTQIRKQVIKYLRQSGTKIQIRKQGMEEDHEIQMADSELKSIYQNSRKLLRLIKHYSEQEGLEAWQQSKITKAADYLNSVLQAVSGQQTR